MKSRRDDTWRKLSKRRQLFIIFAFVIVVVLLMSAIYMVARSIETRNKPEEPFGNLDNRFADVPTINFGGESYRLKKRMTNLLLLGVDTWVANTTNVSDFRNAGQSDFLLLLLIDHETKTITPLQIDRDVMTNVTMLSVFREYAGVRKLQICLSHGFGDGKERSSDLTAKAVSELLLDIPIDFHVSMKLDGISTLNDALGGVKVTLEDDFTSLDPAMKSGSTLTLRGVQAEYYARQRMSIGVGTNASRMVRQQIYIDGLTDLLDAQLQRDANIIGTLFDELQSYLVTNMPRGRMINEAANTREYTRGETVQLEGEHTLGKNGFIEFHADPQALTELILRLCYDKI